MKAVVIVVAASLLILERLLPLPLGLMILVPPIIFGVIVTIRSGRKGISYLNELPNVLRVVFASIGAVLVGFFSPFSVVIGSLFVLLGVLANDEAMRGLYRQKGVIVLTGIDATGKSTHARRISSWLRSRGMKCRIVPFHKYLFLGRISALRKSAGEASKPRRRVPAARTSRFSIIRPYIALVDNVVFYVLRILPRIVEREYVVCDRFIWDNYVKHKALGYRTWALFRLSTLIKPRIGMVFDLPAEIAFERVEKREKHLRYSIDQYETERKEFRRIAKMLHYRIIETNEPIQKTWDKIEAYLTSSI
jgi:thymidylate kinase